MGACLSMREAARPLLEEGVREGLAILPLVQGLWPLWRLLLSRGWLRAGRVDALYARTAWHADSSEAR